MHAEWWQRSLVFLWSIAHRFFWHSWLNPFKLSTCDSKLVPNKNIASNNSFLAVHFFSCWTIYRCKRYILWNMQEWLHAERLKRSIFPVPLLQIRYIKRFNSHFSLPPYSFLRIFNAHVQQGIKGMQPPEEPSQTVGQCF